MPIARLVVGTFDFHVAFITNDACPVDDAMQSAKTSDRLLDDPAHRPLIGHIRGHVLDLATQPLDSLDGTGGQRTSTHENEASAVLLGQIFRHRSTDVAESAGDQIDAALSECAATLVSGN